MKKSLLKKAVSAVLSAALAFSGAAVYFADENGYETRYFLDFESPYAWACAYTGEVYKAAFNLADYYSPSKSLRLKIDGTVGGWSENQFFGTVSFQNPDENGAALKFINGKTYIMSFKAKKAENAKANFQFLRNPNNGDDYNPGLGKITENWKTYSYKFTADDSNGYENGGPTLYIQGEKESEIYFDDVRFIEINDESLLQTKTDVEIISLSAQKLTVKYSGGVSEDAMNAKSYTIGGAEGKSVSYDAANDTYAVVPSAVILPGETTNVSISAGDIFGRPVNMTNDSVEIEMPPLTEFTGSSLGDETEIDTVDSITLSFSNAMDDETALNKDNYTITGSSNVVSSIEKVDSSTYTVKFDGFLKDNSNYTLTVRGLNDMYGRKTEDIELNFNVRKIAAALSYAEPKNGTCGIPSGSVRVNLHFNKTIDKTSLDGIMADNGAAIENISISGSVVSFDLIGLKASSAYTVTVKGVCDTDGNEVPKAVVTYYTELEKTELYNNMFESASDLDWRRFIIGGNDQQKAIDETVYYSEPASAKISMTVNNDMFMAQRDGDSSDIFKVEIGKKYIGSFRIKWESAPEKFDINAVNGDNKSFIPLQIEPADEHGWIKYTYDFIASSADADSGLMNAPSIRIASGGSEKRVNFYFDDWTLYQYPDIELKSSNIPDSAENVSVSDSIEMIFNGAITDANAKIGDAVCSTVIDNNKVLCTPGMPLEYGRYYEIEITVKDLNGLEKLFKKKFKTEHSVDIAGVVVNGSEYSDGMSIKKASNLAVEFKIGKKTAESETICAAAIVYDADGYMKSAECKSITVLPKSASALFETDAANIGTGDEIKIIIWSGLQKTEIIHNSLDIIVE